MDLLFSRYASPFLLLDGMLDTGRFLDFILDFIDIHNNDEIFKIWLHKVYDKSFDDFKTEVMAKPVTRAEIGATIQESENILSGFVPEA